MQNLFNIFIVKLGQRENNFSIIAIAALNNWLKNLILVFVNRQEANPRPVNNHNCNLHT